MEYRVRWEVDVEAESPEEAATKALILQRDPMSWAAVFMVRDEKAEWEEVDLGPYV